MKIINVHISTLLIGDTVIHDGKQRTLTKSNYKKDSFLGVTIYGDSYRLGLDTVKLVTF